MCWLYRPDSRAAAAAAVVPALPPQPPQSNPSCFLISPFVRLLLPLPPERGHQTRGERKKKTRLLDLSSIWSISLIFLFRFDSVCLVLHTELFFHFFILFFLFEMWPGQMVVWRESGFITAIRIEKHGGLVNYLSLSLSHTQFFDLLLSIYRVQYGNVRTCCWIVAISQRRARWFFLMARAAFISRTNDDDIVWSFFVSLGCPWTRPTNPSR